MKKTADSRRALRALGMTGKALALTAMLLCVGCNEDDEVFEEINKLRAVGVSSAPLFGQPSTGDVPQLVTLTFHAGVPLGGTVTAEPFVDDSARYSFPAPLTIVPGSEIYQDLAGMRLYQVQATIAIPTAEQLPILPDPGFARLRYGMRLTSGAEEEMIVGNVLVYPSGAPQLAWAVQTVDVAVPTAGAVVSGDEVEMKGVINKTIDENIRVGWFVTAGRLKNRRAKDTEWQTEAAGGATVIFTTRGLKSGAFAMKAVDVTVK